MALTPEAAKRLALDVLENSRSGEPAWPRGEGGELAPGALRRVGGYTVTGRLGTGGMGEVFRAVQDHPHREVALKLVRPELVSTEARRRFEHEARVLARLQHPGIAQIFDAGEAETDGGPRPYFAMELIEGKPLTEFAGAAELGVRARLGLFLKVCDAVEHAHRKGVVHRDLKPTNILVTASGESKVLDFGVARITDADMQVTTLRTDIGRLIGTIPYMSPEQAAGEAEEVDTRSDVYSLGVVLYELLAGRLPYELSKRPIPEAVRVVKEQEPTPLSSVSREFRGDLETIVAKALEKERERRYQSVGELAGDVRRYLNDEAIVARPASAVYHIRKFTKRNKPVVILIGLLVATVVAGGTAGVSLALVEAATRRRAEDAAELARQQANLATRESARAQATSVVIEGMLRSVGPAVARGRDTTLLREVLDQASEQLEATPPGDLEVEADVRVLIGSVYDDLGEYEAAERMLDVAVGLHHAMPAPGVGYRAALSAGARVKQHLGKLDVAESLYDQAIELARLELSKGDADLYSAVHSVGQIRWSRRDLDGAEKMFNEALDGLTRILGHDHESRCAPLLALGKLSRLRGDLGGAEQLIGEAIRVYRREPTGGALELSTALHELACVRLDARRSSDAVQLLLESIEVGTSVLDAEHPAMLPVRCTLAVALADGGKLEEAETLNRSILERQRALFGADHPSIATTLNNLGVVLRRRQRYDEAAACYEEAIKIDTVHFGEESLKLAESHFNLGALYSTTGDTERAETHLRSALGIWRRAVPEGNEAAGTTMRLLATLLLDQNRIEEAREYASRSYDILRRTHVVWWQPHMSAVILAMCLVQQNGAEEQEFEQAEKLLMGAYEAANDPNVEPPMPKRHRERLIGGLVMLYDRWDKPESARLFRTPDQGGSPGFD